MYKYKLTEKKYTPGGFKVGDVKTQKGRKSTVTDIDPVTGTVTWSIEDVAAFDTVFKNFNKLRHLLKKLEATGEAKEDTTIDSISDDVNDLFNKFRTHIRRNYPNQYKKLSNINEAKKYKRGDKLKIKLKNGKEFDLTFDSYGKQKGMAFGKFKDEDGEFDTKPFSLNTIVESVNEGKESVHLEPNRMIYHLKHFYGSLSLAKHRFKADKADVVQLMASYLDLDKKKVTKAIVNVLKKVKESVNEGWMDDIKNYIDKFFEDHRSRVPEGQKHLVVYFDEFINWTKENRVPKNLVTSLLQRISNEEGKGFLIDIDFAPLEEEEGIGYMTPKAFDKNKKSTGAKDIYYYKLGYKPVPKKIKGSGLEVKQLFEKETLNEFSDFQQKRINQFGEIEEKLNQVSPFLSNAESETVKYYNENPGSYDIVYSTDMINDYVDNIIELLKQEEE